MDTTPLCTFTTNDFGFRSHLIDSGNKVRKIGSKA